MVKKSSVAVIFILLTSLFNGWALTRSTRLDVATALLGTMAGGAGEMAAMSDSLGADSPLVVIMQCTRLFLILAPLALATLRDVSGGNCSVFGEEV